VTLPFLPALAVMLVGAKTSGALSRRIGLPAVFGELVTGLIVGPVLLGWVVPDQSLSDMAELGVLVLMFLAGLETDLPQLRSVGRDATLVTVGGVLLPMAAGVGLGYFSGLGLAPSLFAGAILTATSVSISAQVLWQLGHLNSREGQSILAAAIIDDVLGVIVLTMVIGFSRGTEVLLPFGKMAAFFGLAIFIGRYAIPAFVERVHHRLSSDTTIAIVLAMALGSSWLASELGGVAGITGAYLVGVVFGQTHLRGKPLGSITELGFGFLIPLFFVSVGMAVRPSDLSSAPIFTILLSVTAIVTKVVGCFLGGTMGGMQLKPAWQVSLGMVARGR